MYLQNAIKQNYALLDVCMELHQQGVIPTNSWVIDLDAVEDNAMALAKRANELGLKTYVMSKQHNRNPYVNMLAIANGLGHVVAVDSQGALASARYNVPVGHVGHLNQIPRHQILSMLRLRPEVWTVYSMEHILWINEAAERENVVQRILLSVFKDGDLFFSGQEAGFKLDELPEILKAIKGLKNVVCHGVTSFPCLTYNNSIDEKIVPTPNMDTIMEAGNIIKDYFGYDEIQINAPGNTSCEVMQLLREKGATHVEPGNALLGTTPLHAFYDDLPEKIAIAYVTEISHYFDNRAYAFGGGVYHTAYHPEIFALVGKEIKKAKKVRYQYVEQDIDYHMQLVPDGPKDKPGDIGDSVVFVYRTQMHMTRSYVVPVSGISGRRPLKVHYIFDNACRPLDHDLNPVTEDVVVEDIRNLMES